MRKREHPRHSGLKLSEVEVDFLRRRTIPFLDVIGLDRPLPSLLQEVYLQGLRDAAQVMETPKPRD